ncbi:MAG: tRNA (5-methylaminomethyl-2-thiouridine)(34)-methyltransferase MnmD [Rhodobacteraceae bacterium]|nr:tRNA (5-methylaminomethyl-2-thiouridine)(34)-methyltransferase MnmD [Paracoccaceae bacterium]
MSAIAISPPLPHLRPRLRVGQAMGQGQSATGSAGHRLGWTEEGVPVSLLHEDPYFSRSGGLQETTHVFLDGNDLPARFRPGFHIAEIGFGTGLNLLAAWALFRTAGIPGRLRYTGFEAAPLGAADIARALAPFPALAPYLPPLLAAAEGGSWRIEAPDLEARVIPGDVRDTLPRWQGKADAWFLDGFAPARNPDAWEPALMAEVARHTVPGGSFATYSAAGAVRRALGAAGFAVARAPGFAGKRHMSRGALRLCAGAAGGAV